MPEWLYGQKPTVTCPTCARTDVGTNVDDLANYVKQVLQIGLNPYNGHGAGQEFGAIFQVLMKRAYGHLAPVTRQKIHKLLRKEGTLLMLCRDCWIALAQAEYTKQGLDVVKIRGYLFSYKWLTEHEDDVRQFLAKV